MLAGTNSNRMSARNESGNGENLRERIVRLIKQQGPLSIAQFMMVALHDSTAGYYATHDPFGADFVTAPEISQIFGELLGLWCAQVWEDQGRPCPVRLVELGPGRGTLMKDALRALRAVPEFLAAAEVVLVESSPALAKKQQQLLAHCLLSIRWVNDISNLKHDRPQYVIANEFLDALPIRQYVRVNKGWSERMVGTDAHGNLAFVLAPAGLPNLAVPPERGEAKAGDVYETSPSANAFVEDIARGIASSGGAALLIDYGHLGRGYADTLQAIAKNSFQDVLSSPGEIDISAHVDFGAAARIARAAGADVFGPLEQGEFLLRLGIRARAAQLTAGRAWDEPLAGVERLVSSDQMGALFKVLAILSAGARQPPGF